MGTEGGSLKAGSGQESPVHTQHQILDGFGQRLVVGWLTCDKLTREQPALRVILVSGQPSAEQSRFADFVGASALVSRKASVRALAREVLGDLLPAAS
jgi:hypothetical protein